MRLLLLAAALVGFAAVALGAFGAHGLDGRIGAEAKAWWNTATMYALVHAAAALSLALRAEGGALTYAGAAFVVGAVLFSGSLYALALGAPRILGAVAPLGGTSFLFGWGLCAYAAFKAD